MTEEIGPDDPDRLRADAADWLVRVNSDAAGEDDWLALETWLAGSPARRAAFDEAERLWSELDEHAAALLPRLDAGEGTAPSLAGPQVRARRRPTARWAPILAIAASLVVAVLGAWLLRPVPAAQVFATAMGERRTVLLADGSRIELSSATRVTARVDRRHRRVTLEGGEAVFDVAKDSAHPFVVAVGDQRVTVVGTQFDILRHDGRIAVTVSRGLVDVRPAKGGAVARLSPGQQLRHREGADTSSVFNVPVEDVFAWRDGYLVYRTRTLAEVASDLNRYFPTPVTVEGKAAQLTFSGALMIDDEDAVLNRLQSFLPITVVRTPERITIRSR